MSSQVNEQKIFNFIQKDFTARQSVDDGAFINYKAVNRSLLWKAKRCQAIIIVKTQSTNNAIQYTVIITAKLSLANAILYILEPSYYAQNSKIRGASKLIS